MAVKLTKNEQKKQKDALKQFNRYLPTLQLKKQQLQICIRQIEAQVEEYRRQQRKLIDSLDSWIAVYGENPLLGDRSILSLVSIDTIVKGRGNIAGVGSYVQGCSLQSVRLSAVGRQGHRGAQGLLPL